ncbi:MAG TPA: GAF domain-containing sensor histidine kinase [Cryomorphaceae bacterium]|nr:GAF domain-containing sensor histidine kinase [Cryomorphaceae bacterium]
MILPLTPVNEDARLEELSLLQILDTLPEEDYDAITAMASEICNVPISLISLIDKKRQWFKSIVGVDFTETPRDQAFCAHAINHPGEIFEVKNAKEDDRFHDNPLVTMENGVVFYAGIPLVSDEGNALGTLCLIDTKPRELTENQRKALSILSMSVIRLLELRKKKIEAEQHNKKLKRSNDLLKNFANVASHDLKSPLNNIIGLANVLNSSESPSPAVIRKFGGLIVEASESLKSLIEDILDYSKSEKIFIHTQESVSIQGIVEGCLTHYSEQPGVQLTVDNDFPSLRGHKAVWKQIIYNLVSNAINHNDKDLIEVKITSCIKGANFHLRISDNGPGIPEDKKEEIFNPLVTLKQTKKGENFSGMGLATVKKLITSMQGQIEIQPNTPIGTVFIISAPFHQTNVHTDKTI